MDRTGYIEISVSGKMGNIELTPDNYDIREIMSILESAEDLLFPGDKNDRPIISYQIEAGSVKNILKTSIQFVIGFNAVIGQVASSHSIDFLNLPTAKAFENIQRMALKKDYTFTIRTSLERTETIKIDTTTNYLRTEATWVDAEFYFYGKVTNAGGKDKANIHILTDDMGTVRVQTPIAFLQEYEHNMLYKTLGVRANGKQHSETGEIDRTTLRFVRLVEYDASYDDNYLKHLREKAKRTWLGTINPDQWLRELRGGYDA